MSENGQRVGLACTAKQVAPHKTERLTPLLDDGMEVNVIRPHPQPG